MIPMNLLRLFRHIDRSTRRSQASRRRPLVENLEGRQLLSSVSFTPDIVGKHQGTNVAAAIQGNHIGTNVAAAIQGNHIGTNVAAILGNHIGTNVV
jgi:hypothetical protein